MNLANLNSIAALSLNPDLAFDTLELNGNVQEGQSLFRVQNFLDRIRKRYEFSGYLQIQSSNNFPLSAGIASSASAFAALSLAVVELFNLQLNQNEISALARLGSGSACRSIPPGFCEWQPGKSHEESFAVSIASENHWSLFDCIVLVEKTEKEISSTQGHKIASTSPLQRSRVQDAPRRLEKCISAILKKDFLAFSEIIELDSDMMHAVMMTSRPPINYWHPTTVAIMREVRNMRKNGIAAAYTLDAGPNVHVICTEEYRHEVAQYMREIPGVIEVMISPPGKGASIVSNRNRD
jgi:diphosphomevalonate decarboxylase